jgi:hypothetical protein
MAKIVTIDRVYSKPTNREKSQNSQKIGSKEEIVSATYTDPDTNKVSEGEDHLEANPDAPKKQEDRETQEYEFKTSNGRIVSRKEAYSVAKKANQLKELHPKKILHTSNLKKPKRKK